jgi:hypothetical protein
MACYPSRRYDHASRPQHGAVVQPVSALVDLDHGPRLGAFDGLLSDCLVMLGIEALAHRRIRLYPHTRERGDHTGVNELDP